VGKTVRVVVTYTDDQGTLETVSSAATAEVTNTNDLPLGSVDISDITPTETQTLTAALNFTDEDGTTTSTFLYQWEEFNGTDWVAIAGATGETFTPGQAQVNKELRVTVSYVDDFGQAETITSDPTIVTGDLHRHRGSGHHQRRRRCRHSERPRRRRHPKRRERRRHAERRRR
jgi:hypothetical protein